MENINQEKWVIFTDCANLSSESGDNGFVWLHGNIYTNKVDVKKRLMRRFFYDSKQMKLLFIDINETPSAIVDSRFKRFQEMYGPDYHFNYNTKKQKLCVKIHKLWSWRDWQEENSFENIDFDIKEKNEEEKEIVKQQTLEIHKQKKLFNEWYKNNLKHAEIKQDTKSKEINYENILLQLQEKEQLIDSLLNTLQLNVLTATNFYGNSDCCQYFICKFDNFEYNQNDILVPEYFLKKIFDHYF